MHVIYICAIIVCEVVLSPLHAAEAMDSNQYSKGKEIQFRMIIISNIHEMHKIIYQKTDWITMMDYINCLEMVYVDVRSGLTNFRGRSSNPHLTLLLNEWMTVLHVPRSLFGHTEEEYIPDAESVYLHREQHHQPQACTLAQCFQLYTKEEQVIL